MSQRIALLCNVFIFSTLCCFIEAYSDTVDASVTYVEPDISVGEDGLINVSVEDCENSGKPGAPLLPVQTLYYALPPDTDIESVILTTGMVSTATMDIPGVVNPAPAMGAGASVFYGDATNVIDGRDMDIYLSDQYYPVCDASIDHVGQMRKWILVRVCVSPVQYNPVQQQLRYIQSANYQLVYETKKQRGWSSILSDTMMDDQAMQLIDNQDEAQEWYSTSRSVSSYNVYAIITTDTIYNQSPGLYGLVAHKQSLGYTVYVVTETGINGNSASIGWNEVTGQTPDGKAERIRKWLQNNYSGYHIRYVLLIGNPHPDSGDVPMKKCFPRYGEGISDDAPTDAYYADLTGNWDRNGDQLFGDYTSDRGSGGVDFLPEVYVGRIPVYGADYVTLSNILTKIIHYQMDVSTAWRRSALLPESYSDDSTDGAYLAVYMLSNYLNPASYRTYTMYQQGSIDPRYDSIYSSDEELLSYSVPNHWSANKYGLISWFGHGSSSDVGVYGGGTLMSSSKCRVLDDRFPTLGFMVSCNCGYPETSGNLGYALLKNGGIGSISSSRVSWYRIGTWTPNLAYADNMQMAYSFMQDIVYDQYAFGQAWFESKSTMGEIWQGVSWMNQYVFNLYGDPGVKLFDSYGTDSDGDLIPDYWENQYGLLPGDPSDADDDPDGDGFSNYQEYMNHTSPLVCDSMLSDYSSMTVAGRFQGWEPTDNNMTLVDNYSWAGDVQLAAITNVQFRFFANGCWQHSWGDSAQQDSAVPISDMSDHTAHNMVCSGILNGMYHVTFNERTLWYSFELCE